MHCTVHFCPAHFLSHDLPLQPQLLYLAVQDPGVPTSYKFNAEASVSVWTRYGRSKVGVAEHIQLLKAFQPNVFECLYDFAPSRENKMKRVSWDREYCSVY